MLWGLRISVGLWILGCLWAAGQTRDAVLRLQYGPREVGKVATSLDAGARQLHELSGTPVVGRAVDAVAGTIDEAQKSTRKVTRWSSARIDQLAVQLWRLVFWLPTVPALLVLALAEWLSRRLRRVENLRRDVEFLRSEVVELRAELAARAAGPS